MLKRNITDLNVAIPGGLMAKVLDNYDVSNITPAGYALYDVTFGWANGSDCVYTNCQCNGTNLVTLTLFDPTKTEKTIISVSITLHFKRLS